MRDLPDAGGPVINSDSAKDKDSVSLLAGRARAVGKLRRKLVHHSFELDALVSIQDLHNAGLPGGSQIVELILQALIVLAVIVEHQRKFFGLRRRETKLALETVENRVMAGLMRVHMRGWCRRTMNPAVQTELHR